MRFPSYIILDINNIFNSKLTHYWTKNYLINFKTNIDLWQTMLCQNNVIFVKKKLIINLLTLNKNKFSIIFSSPNFTKITHSTKKLNLFSKTFFKNQNTLYINNFVFALTTFLNLKLLLNITKLWALFDINFLKKEKMYTKLKYSRTPQYDIVSGGTAAIFAGFLGFLICEKFGFELIDSGDFYFLFMYCVFFSFFCRMFFKLFSQTNLNWSFLSLKWLLIYLQILFNFLNIWCKTLLQYLK